MSKGVSEIISAVLVLAIGVTMAGVFSGWLPGFAEEATGDTVEAQTQDMECENADIRVSDVEYDGINQFTGIKVENTGRIRLSNGVTVSAINNSKLMNQTEVEFLGVGRSRNITVDTSGKPDRVLVTGEGCPDLGKDMVPETTLNVIASTSNSDSSSDAHVWLPSEASDRKVTETGDVLQVNYTGHSAKLYELTSLENGSIVTSSKDKEVHVWNPRKGVESGSISSPDVKYTGHDNSVKHVGVDAEGNVISASHYDSGDNKVEVHLWDPDNAGGDGKITSPDVNYTGHSNSNIPGVQGLENGGIASSSKGEVHIWRALNGISDKVSLPDGSLKGYWKLNESSSPSKDYSTHTNEGTWQNSLTPTAGVQKSKGFWNGGGAVELTSDGYINAGSSSSLTQTPPFTVVGWVSTTQSSGDYCVACKIKSGSSRSYGLLVSDGKVDAYLGDAGSGYSKDVAPSVDIADGELHHIGVSVYSNNSVFYYVGGQKDGSATVDTTYSQGADLWLGKREAGGYGLDGKIDEIRVYNDTLTSEQYSDLYEANTLEKLQVEYTGHKDDKHVFDIIELSDGRIASSSYSGKVHVWDPNNADADGNLADSDMNYTGHGDKVYGLEELDDGRIASASYDEEVHIWNPDNAEGGVLSEPEVNYTGHSGDLLAVDVMQLRDGRIVSTSQFGQIHVWEPESGVVEKSDADIIYKLHAKPINIIEISGGLE